MREPADRSNLVGGQGVTAMVRGTMLLPDVFSTVVLHELATH